MYVVDVICVCSFVVGGGVCFDILLVLLLMCLEFVHCVLLYDYADLFARCCCMLWHVCDRMMRCHV